MRRAILLSCLFAPAVVAADQPEPQPLYISSFNYDGWLTMAGASGKLIGEFADQFTPARAGRMDAFTVGYYMDPGPDTGGGFTATFRIRDPQTKDILWSHDVLYDDATLDLWRTYAAEHLAGFGPWGAVGFSAPELIISPNRPLWFTVEVNDVHNFQGQFGPRLIKTIEVGSSDPGGWVWVEAPFYTGWSPVVYDHPGGNLDLKIVGAVPTAAIPEPATVLIVGAAGLLRRRRARIIRHISS